METDNFSTPGHEPEKETAMSETGANEAYVTTEWIRRPLPELGGTSPQDAAGDPSGRKRLEDLFVELAGHYVRLHNLGLPAFDPADLRKALGMQEAHPGYSRQPARSVRLGPVKRSALLEELGTALTGGDVDSVAFFNVKTGAIEHFMHNLGDQETARISQAQADPNVRKITPVTTEVRYGIMSDFISLVEDINTAGRLRSAISGKGAFRRFREAVDEDDTLRRRWLAYRTKRHYLLALDWLHKLGLAPEDYGLIPTDYDWQPTAEPEPAHAEPARESGRAASGERVTSNGEAGHSEGSAPDATAAAGAQEIELAQGSGTAGSDESKPERPAEEQQEAQPAT